MDLPHLGTAAARLNDDFMEHEVMQAVKASRRGKATFPDDIGNDWYKDRQEQIVSLLVVLFAAWAGLRLTRSSF